MVKLADVPAPSPETIKEYMAWAEERPECIRDLAKRFVPNTIYRMIDTKQPCILAAISEDRKVCVAVFDRLIFDLTGELVPSCHVFDVDPDKLEVLHDPSAKSKAVH